MDELHGFLCHGPTADGDALAIGGLFPEGENPGPLFCRAISSFTARGSNDPFFVDYLLAEMIRRTAPASVRVVGASLARPGLGSGGGVIGAPSQGACSAAERAHAIAPDMHCLTLPGVLGLAAQVRPETVPVLHSLLKGAAAGTLDMTGLKSLCAALSRHARTFVLTVDGSVPGRTGYVAVRCGGPLRAVALSGTP